MNINRSWFWKISVPTSCFLLKNSSSSFFFLVYSSLPKESLIPPDSLREFPWARKTGSGTQSLKLHGHFLEWYSLACDWRQHPSLLLSVLNSNRLVNIVAYIVDVFVHFFFFIPFTCPFMDVPPALFHKSLSAKGLRSQILSCSCRTHVR